MSPVRLLSRTRRLRRLSPLRPRVHAATAGVTAATGDPRAAPGGLPRATAGPFSTTTWRTSAGDGPRPVGSPAGRDPGRGPPAAAAHDRHTPDGGRPDAGGPQGDARPRAAAAPAVRPRRARGRPVSGAAAGREDRRRGGH